MNIVYQPVCSSPSSCSGETLIGSPFATPSKTMSVTAAASAGAHVPMLNDLLNNVSLSAPAPQRPRLLRRNAVSGKPSNDDTIVCHGPLFGVVFGNVSGGSGNLSYAGTDLSSAEDKSYFTVKAVDGKTRKKRSSASRLSTSSQATTTTTAAFYLSPSYGLPELSFDQSSSSTCSSSGSSEEEGEDDAGNISSSSASSFECVSSVAASRRAALCRSPPSYSLSSFLDDAPLPPPRCAATEACYGAALLDANRAFFDAIPGAPLLAQQPFSAPPSTVWRATKASPRTRQASQRISVQQVALQAGSVASARRRGGVAAAVGTAL